MAVSHPTVPRKLVRTMTPEFRRRAVDVYAAGHSTRKTCEILGICMKTLRAIMRIEGAAARSRFVRCDGWSEEEYQILRAHFPTAGRDAVAIMLNRSPAAVQRQAAMLGIRSEVTVDLRAKSQREGNDSVNIHYFETWSPNMAWLLGYIWADGTVTKTHKNLGMGCKTADEKILLDALADMKSNHNVIRLPAKVSAHPKSHKTGPFTKVAVCSRYLVATLMKLHGIQPAKSRRDLPFPTNIPDEFIGHFARGNLDGDGCVSGNSVSFYATKTWLEGLRSAMCRLAGIKANRVCYLKHTRMLHGVRWSSKADIVSLYHFLYPPGEYIYLARKRTRLEAAVAVILRD